MQHSELIPSRSESFAKQAYPTPVMEASGVVKIFGTFNAVSGVDIRVMPGEIYGLLGPNGAGKSTIIKIIAGLLEPTSGSVRVMGYDVTTDSLRVKSSIGYVSETSLLYDSLSPRDFFEFIASVRKLDKAKANERVSKLAGAFGLGPYYDSPIATLSMGTKQKVSIVAAFLHEPPLLLLDEPLNGLDAKSSRILKDLISFQVQEKNGAVLFSTHVMEVAEHLCSRIGIIDGGKIIAEGSLDDLRSKAGEQDRFTSNHKKTLEEVFLELTHEEDEVEDIVNTLREAFSTR
jgi:ABC-2 type transport system ATP-binding protein